MLVSLGTPIALLIFMGLFDLIGIVGVVFYLLAYGLLQAEKCSSTARKYLFFNGLGALLALVSLSESWNLAAFVSNLCWLTITAYSYFKIYGFQTSQRELSLKTNFSAQAS